MNIFFEVKQFSLNHLPYKELRRTRHFYLSSHDKNAHFPCYDVSVRCVFEYNGATYRKLYRAFYVEAPQRNFANCKHAILYKSWVIETPYFSFSSKQENQKIKKQIKRALFSFLDELETTRILPLEEKNKPILSKAWIKKIYDDTYEIVFILKKQGGKYEAIVKYEPYVRNGIFAVDEFYKSAGFGLVSEIRPPSVYWRDHIMIQLAECIRKRSKYRMRYLGHFDTYRFSNFFIPSQYPLDNVKIEYEG